MVIGQQFSSLFSNRTGTGALRLRVTGCSTPRSTWHSCSSGTSCSMCWSESGRGRSASSCPSERSSGPPCRSGSWSPAASSSCHGAMCGHYSPGTQRPHICGRPGGPHARRSSRSCKLPCVVEGGIQHIGHEAGVPLHASHLRLVPGHVLIQTAHTTCLVLVQPQQGGLAGLVMHPYRQYA